MVVINKTLNKEIKEIRRKGLKKFKGGYNTISWKEKDFLGESVSAGVIILSTRGCRWGLSSGCSMCGYVYDSIRKRQNGDEILKQFKDAFAKVKDVEYLKIFNSGSFFDDSEISDKMRQKIFAMINEKKIKRLQVESRPEFLNSEKLKEAKKNLKAQLEVGIGLETTNDDIRVNCINKGFLLEDFINALNICKEFEVETKAYLLIKPLFLGEKEALEDAVNSAVEVSKLGVSRISFNPVNVQKGTLLEYMWRRGEYRPPWLWTVVETLKKTRRKVRIPILSHPVATGKRRGPHNCGECNGDIHNAIINFSITQDHKYLNGKCDCEEMWKDYLELEDFRHS